VSARRELLLGWYLPLLGGLVPILVFGFLESALADRTVFAGWALAAAAAYTITLRQTLATGWSRPKVAGAVFLVLGAALAWLAYLLDLYREILDLGSRAVLPAGLQPVTTVRPEAIGWLAVALAGLGAFAWARAALLSRQPRRAA
jgi:hypothetical protein